MKIFVAGASGAIGRPLLRLLMEARHEVAGLTNSDRGERAISELGAVTVRASAFDAESVERALRRFQPEVVIDELTFLPADPTRMAEAAPEDRRIRLEGGGNLHRAAQVCGVRRYLQQASAFFLAPGDGLADESVGLAVDASPRVAASARTYAQLEQRTLEPRARAGSAASSMEGLALRYGFFYGPGTWYNPDGAAADQVRAGQVPVIGEGSGVWSWVHIEDAARGTVQALEAPAGVYHITDDTPLPVRDWLPAFAKAVGAPPPPHMTLQQALEAAGEDAVYYGTRLRGASNRKARAMLGFTPRSLEWLRGS